MSNERKPKRTKEVLLAEANARVAKLTAQIEGTWVAENAEKTGVKAVKAAIRRRKTALHQAKVLINGRAPTAKSPALPGIYGKIENAKLRLANMNEAADRGEAFIANLPFDIERLDALLELSEQEGEEIEVPNGLFKMGGEEDITEAEHEANSVTANDTEEDYEEA
jgi:hypothetical protein